MTLLSQGTFGKVYDLGDGTVSKNVKVKNMTIIEIYIMKGMDHPNLMKAKEIIIDKQIANIIMEKMTPLNKLKLDFDTALDYFYQICSATYYLYSYGIAHLDIKPKNILVKDKNAYLTDFSLSMLYHNQPLNYEVQTINYRAPEVFLGRYYIKEGLDIFSLGCLLYYLIKGENLFDYRYLEILEDNNIIEYMKNTIKKSSEELPENIREIFLGMTKIDKEKRIKFKDVFKLLGKIDKKYEIPIVGNDRDESKIKHNINFIKDNEYDNVENIIANRILLNYITKKNIKLSEINNKDIKCFLLIARNICRNYYFNEIDEYLEKIKDILITLDFVLL